MKALFAVCEVKKKNSLETDAASLALDYSSLKDPQIPVVNELTNASTRIQN